MEKRDSLTVNEGNPPEIQAKSPSFSENFVTGRIECMDCIADDLAF